MFLYKFLFNLLFMLYLFCLAEIAEAGPTDISKATRGYSQKTVSILFV